MPAKASVLVADDEAAIADLVVRVLRAEGMEARAVYSGTQALEALREGGFDLAILDVMMPDMDGFEVCRRVRATSEVPIVFLTAKDEEVDQVVGLSLGADDYIVKPFRPRILVARVKARLRERAAALRTPSAQRFEAKGIVVDAAAHEASLHGEPLRLTPKEFGVLLALVRAGGRPVSAKELYEQVWGEQFAPSSGNSVMVHIRHLRGKLAAIDPSQEFLSTVWGVGYRMNMGERASRGGEQGGASR